MLANYIVEIKTYIVRHQVSFQFPPLEAAIRKKTFKAFNNIICYGVLADSATDGVGNLDSPDALLDAVQENIKIETTSTTRKTENDAKTHYSEV